MPNWGRMRLGSRGLVFTGIVLVALVALLHALGPPLLDRLGLLLFDSYQRAMPRSYEKTPVKVVDIDDESIRRVGQWPWPRSDIAKLTDRLGQAGASVVAYDVVFSEPDRTSPARIAAQLAGGAADSATLAALRRMPDHDAELARSFSSTPVVLGYFLSNDQAGPQVTVKAGFSIGGSPPGDMVPTFRRGIESLAVLSANAAGSGSVSRAADSDGILRTVPMLARQGDQLLPSLSLEALRVAQGARSILVRTSNASGETSGSPGRIVAIKVGQFEIPTTASGGLWLHYTRPVPARTIPAWKILDSELSPAELESAVSGRIVFVGAGAMGLRDLISTPLSDQELGVMAHAQAAEQAILSHFLRRPDWAPGLEMGLILVLGIALALLLPRLGAARGALVVLLAIGLVGGGSWLAFAQRGYLLDPTYPVLALVLVYSAETVLVFYREERRRAYIHSAFDRFLSPELVRRIAADPDRLELGGEERDMTVLFCDVRNFSGISEHLAPKQVIGFLIALLTPLCDVLLARKATIDKFIGDAIVAFWNAPLEDHDQHRNAARAALEMVRRLGALNAGEGRDPDAPWPGPVRIGVGLNCGVCCVGNMGSAQRLSYSLIGDTVNLTSRIEGLTKFYGVSIAIGKALHDNLFQFATLEMDLVRVVGRATPERIFVLIGDEELAGLASFANLRQRHDAMLTSYRNRDWDAARQQMPYLTEHGKAFDLSGLYALYGDRIAALAAEPPPDGWDGIYNARDK